MKHLHAFCCSTETIEAMQHPRKYFKSYCLGFLPLFFMIVPPGILLNVAFAKAGIATAGECERAECVHGLGESIAVTS